MLWEQYEDLCIATAVLLGAEPKYDDYGHKERRGNRMYWSCRPPGGPDAYGYTRAEACRKWLLKKGIKIHHKTGEITKTIPHSYLSYLGK